jgi:hypothetical protein
MPNVTITNTMGQELETVFMNSNELDISSFINGIYFIKITMPNSAQAQPEKGVRLCAKRYG